MEEDHDTRPKTPTGISRRHRRIGGNHALPQALPAIVPALMGFFISLVKDTSLAYIVGLYELTRTAKIIAEREFRPLEIYVVIALVYFVLCFPLSRIVSVFERRLHRSGLAQERLAI